MMRIRLTKDEFDYLISSEFVPEHTRKEILDTVQQRSADRFGREKVVLELSEVAADLVREICGDQLPVKGFNADYSLNREGKILESLIDKFFTG